VKRFFIEGEMFWECVEVKQRSNQQSFIASSNTDRFEPLLNSEEPAALIKIHPKTLQRMARNGEVTGIRIGKLWRFLASSLNRWLEKIATHGEDE